MTVLVAFGTIEGQSGKIARFVADEVQRAGKAPRLFDTSDKTAPLDLTGIDAAVLVASVHERRHPETFEVFVSAQKSFFASIPVMMISVSLSAAFEEKRDEAQDYLDEMKLRTGLAPQAEVLCAGAVKPSSYDYFESQVLRHVVLEGRDIDISSGTHEFTEWSVLRAELRGFLSP